MNCLKLIVLIAALRASAAPGVTSQTNVRTVTGFAENPNNKELFGYDSEASNKVLAREILKYETSPALRLEFNAYNLLLGSTDKASASQLILNGTEERNRTPKLERHWHDSHNLDGYLTVDRLNVRSKVGAGELAVGRFPINMATTTMFAPNDFFAPFRPETFYREYKPGVDAAKFDYGFGKNGQVSVMGVAGYSSEALVGRVGKPQESHYSATESSALLRASYTLAGFEGALLGGKLGAFDMAGFTLQGEAGPFGIRAEGHQKKHRTLALSSAEAAAGIDCRPLPPLILTFEQFFHGSGYGSAADYAKLKDDPNPPLLFIGRNYSGLTAAYDLTPLVNLKSVVIGNMTDKSALISTNASYAVAENADVSVAYLLPQGKGPAGKEVRSEYGTYPRILTFETGIYW